MLITYPLDDLETGDHGWSPVFAVVTDGARRVLQVTGWTGGTGSAPASGKYVGSSGLVTLIADAVDVRGGTGATGSAGADAYVYLAYASDDQGTGFTTTFNPALDYLAVKTTTSPIASPAAGDFAGLWKNYKGPTGSTGGTGDQGQKGWSPVFSLVEHLGTRRLLQLYDWVGGAGSDPGQVGHYVGLSGLTNNPADAVDVRGPAGADGTSLGQDSGWSAMTGSSQKDAAAVYTAPTISDPPTQAEVQALADHVAYLSQRMKALTDALMAGNIPHA